ncbi:hypothetical protein [Williamsia deligens]|uniref:Uncharacterized protein n=1 Tax=Williamsia deligens TaxID=321325 RepID=A0ABW3GAE4_9NOCA|nr:hypothetical protein [Williamsia deligens]
MHVRDTTAAGSLTVRSGRAWTALDGQQLRCVTWAAGAVFLAATAGMARFEMTMAGTGGPGIIAFELAGSGERATAILDRWGDEGCAAARRSIAWDFGYMTSYGAVLVLLTEDARRRITANRWATMIRRVGPWVCGLAVAADAVEGVSLTTILAGHPDRDTPARRARRAALTKFAAIGVVLVTWTSARVLSRGMGQSTATLS